jgi:hypothetical protein
LGDHFFGNVTWSGNVSGNVTAGIGGFHLHAGALGNPGIRGCRFRGARPSLVRVSTWFQGPPSPGSRVSLRQPRIT